MTFEPQNVETMRTGLPGLQSLQIDGAAPLGRLGGLQVRLARTPAEVEAAQELRHRVFQQRHDSRRYFSIFLCPVRQILTCAAAKF